MLVMQKGKIKSSNIIELVQHSLMFKKDSWPLPNSIVLKSYFFCKIWTQSHLRKLVNFKSHTCFLMLIKLWWQLKHQRISHVSLTTVTAILRRANKIEMSRYNRGCDQLRRHSSGRPCINGNYHICSDVNLVLSFCWDG